MKKTILLLAGGDTNEREVSLKTGQSIYDAIDKEIYTVVRSDVTSRGVFIVDEGGAKKDYGLKELVERFAIDFVYIALHGRFGEDGHIQALLDTAGLSYNGSGLLASAIAFDKDMCYRLMLAEGVEFPAYVRIEMGSESQENIQKIITDEIDYPCVVKPNTSGSSVGVSIVRHESDLKKALENAWEHDTAALVQACIQGKELTCGVMGNTGQTELEALPVVEIKPHEGKFFDYQEKYSQEGAQEVCPAQIAEELTKRVQEVSLHVHEALGCRGLTRSDFMFDEETQTVYFLEINTLPGQTKTSLCPKEAKAAGMSYEEFVQKQIELGMGD
jgi:D-alanine-D-alanine ligase